ncbi:MAG: glycosyltransferase family 2 protein [Thermoplasmata archaeon]
MTPNLAGPLVSVIVPSRNSGETIIPCLNSIHGQSYDNTEIIVVDNFSTDDTVSKARGLAERVLQKGPERSAQKNHGARNANGQYIAFVDSDMVVSRTVLEECVEAAAHADACIVPQATIGRDFWGRCVTEGQRPSRLDPTKHAPRFFDKEVFLQLGGYNEDLVYGEDKDLQRRALNQGVKIARTTSVLYHIDKAPLRARTLKFLYYGRHISNYISHTQDRSSFMPLKPSYWRRVGRIRRPLHFAGFLLLKLIEYEAYLLARGLSR